MDPNVKSKKGMSNVWWRVAVLKGNPNFFACFKQFPEAHAFPFGCSHVHIRGRTGRPRGGPSGLFTKNKNHNTKSLSSSSSSSAKQEPSFASVTVSEISPRDVVISKEEMNALLPIPGSASSSQSGEFSGQSQPQSQSQSQVKQRSKGQGRGFVCGNKKGKLKKK